MCVVVAVVVWIVDRCIISSEVFVIIVGFCRFVCRLVIRLGVNVGVIVRKLFYKYSSNSPTNTTIFKSSPST